MRRRYMNIYGTSNVDYNNYMSIEMLEEGTISTSRIVEYAVDGIGWNVMMVNNPITFLKGQIVSFKCVLGTNDQFGRIKISGKCNLKGNCLSLIYGDSAYKYDNVPLQALSYLFTENPTIISVDRDFLPATTLGSSCYQSMFSGCTSLVEAPELPATTLGSSCYKSMFYGCTSLVEAPELPATTLESSCYQSMFYGCSSLTTAPELPATTLTNYCYNNMFDNCNKLNYIKMLATDISATKCLGSWVNGVASTGTFVKNPNMTSLPKGDSGIPSGWTVVNDGED